MKIENTAVEAADEVGQHGRLRPWGSGAWRQPKVYASLHCGNSAWVGGEATDEACWAGYLRRSCFVAVRLLYRTLWSCSVGSVIGIEERGATCSPA